MFYPTAHEREMVINGRFHPQQSQSKARPSQGAARVCAISQDPDDIVCKIGDDWFYFTDLVRNSKLQPREFLKTFGDASLMSDLLKYMNGEFASEFPDEFAYCVAVIKETWTGAVSGLIARRPFRSARSPAEGSAAGFAGSVRAGAPDRLTSAPPPLAAPASRPRTRAQPACSPPRKETTHGNRRRREAPSIPTRSQPYPPSRFRQL